MSADDAIVPSEWDQRLRATQDALDEALAELRHERDLTAIAREEIAALRDELDAAQRLTARALDRLVVAQADEAEARDLLEQERAAHAAGVAADRPQWQSPFRRRRGARGPRSQPDI